MPYNIDNQILNFFVSLRTPAFNTFFKTISEFGEIYIAGIFVLVVLFILYKNKQKSFLIFFLSTVIIGEATIQILKLIIARARPPIEFALVHESSFSFPSAHAATAILVFLSILIIVKALGKNLNKYFKALIYTTLIIFIVFIPISRLYLGIHWFSDVLGGLLIGFITLFLSYKLIRPNLV